MVYCMWKKGMWEMNEAINNLYRLPNVDQHQDLDLLTLSENCAILEEQVQGIAKALPDRERCVLQAYIHARNDLEVETFKTALRWGKQHYK